jgi:hypothetical protein
MRRGREQEEIGVQIIDATISLRRRARHDHARDGDAREQTDDPKYDHDFPTKAASNRNRYNRRKEKCAKNDGLPNVVNSA